MNKKPIFCVLGRSGVGKDSVVNGICKDGQYKVICSYTTRPKRINEGNTHLFISEEEASKKENVIAKTEISGYKYFVTREQLDGNDFYIIDPKGLSDLKSNEELCKDYEFIAVMIWIPEDIRLQRVRTRGDNPEVAQKRTESENAQFTTFEAKAEWDYQIENTNLADSINKLRTIVKQYGGKNK